MPTIEASSGVETVITSFVHYGFRWMGDHWKQEIACFGDCEAIPRIWSVEGAIGHEPSARDASPPYRTIAVKPATPAVAVARLEGRSGSHQYRASFSFQERPDGVLVEVEVEGRGAPAGEAPMATYLVESSDGHLERQGTATITWPYPDATLVFEAEAPARVEAHEAGLGTIRLKAIAPHDPSSEVQALRYRWRWITRPGRQIWDREA